MRALRLAVAFAAMLGLAACQNPNGSTDYLRTGAAGAAAGAGVALLGGLVNDVSNSQARDNYGYSRRR